MTSQDRETRFRELLERNHPRFAGIARSYASASDREDLLQEILVQIWKSLDGFLGRSRIDTWAYRVALNTALTWGRASKSKGGPLPIQPFPENEPAGALASEAWEMRILEEFLASLSKADRAVMLLYLDDVPNPEAAEITGLTESALRVRLHRIRKLFEKTYCDREVSNDI